ncbi:MAG: UDP-N-acetylmuramate--L-alanine ligase [bacterium]|nr:UDP-N-acetylmuramate--L-alanine ligase [bacterium]
MLELRPGMRLHFVGIGGVGMSALAELMHLRGYEVTGSDRQASAVTKRLDGLGIAVQIGHSAEAVGGAEAVIHTAAVGNENPEVAEAQKRDLMLVKRAYLLGLLCKPHRVVAVAGTHGKTTTTAMVGAVLEAAGLDPTVVVGGMVQGLERNLRVGASDWWVVEADEYDRSFLTLNPEVAVVTSLEADHLDCYGNLAAIREAFEQFLGQTRATAVLCADAFSVQGLVVGNEVERVSYGLVADARIRAEGMDRAGFGSQFRVMDGTQVMGELTLQLPGLHNVHNALAAAGVGAALGLAWEAVRMGLENFRGVRRRFEILGEVNGVTVVNDYAHHPTEVQTTLEAARAGWSGRVVAVFQPHLYSRTRDFAVAFGAALAGADRVWVGDVYAAREEKIAGVDGELIAGYVRESGGPETTYIPELGALTAALVEELAAGDLLVVMGAGNVEQVAFDVLKNLEIMETKNV